MPLKTPKIKIFEKWKNLLEISSFYIHAPKITIIWYIVSEMQSEIDKCFCHFGPFFALLSPPLLILNIKILKKNEKNAWRFYPFIHNVHHIIYGSWNRRCDRQKFWTFLGILCPFNTLTTWKIKILTLKKTLGDVIILHICTINDNRVMHGSWNMECNRHNFLSVCTVFCPFTPLWTQKIKIFKKMEKTCEDIIILQT